MKQKSQSLYLLASGALLLLLMCPLLPAASGLGVGSSTVDRDLETVRKRVIAYVMRAGVDETEVERILDTLTPGGYWPDIDYEDVSRTGFQHSEHLGNMLHLARAYRKPGNRFAGDPELKKAIHSAFDFWIEHDFRCENWWWNDMGTPLSIINLMLIMDTDLTENQRREGLRIAGRAHMQSAGARPGGDLIRVATIWGKRGVFMRDPAVLEEVVQIIAAEMKTTTGRGLKPDLSHHHRYDNVISTLSYGMYLPSQLSTWALFIDGTRFSLPKPATKLLVDFFLDGVCRSMAYGRYPDPGAKNRGISRRGALHPAGPGMAEDLYRISHYRRDELKAIADIRRGQIEPNLRYTSFFWHSEYFIHQRPDWFASVRMHSARNHNMEYPHNEEGLKNHHFADGSNFLTRTAQEYVEIFPVWDWQRVPGTTVVQKPELPHWNQIAKKGRTLFVGGVADGQYGAAAFDFESPHDPLKARTAWFFFDDEYVCLGSGITAQADRPVNTTVSQCHLVEDVAVGHDGATTILAKGEHALRGVTWVHHNDVAYVFPSAEDVYIRNTTSTGSWRQINHQAWASDREIRADLFALWFDHGVRPRNGSYQYVVIPRLKLSAVERYRSALPIRILSNTTSLQAVRHNGLDITQMVFYEAGEMDLGEGLSVEVDKRCMVMLQKREGRVERIAVSDPSRAHNTLEVVLAGSCIEGAGDRWNATWNKNENTSRIAIDLPQEKWAGKSVILDRRCSTRQ
jgi:chondroitin AC lyase